MKIDRERDKINSFGAPGKKGVQGVKKSTASSSFEQELAQRRDAESQYRMQEILKEIDRLNDKLNRSLNINDLMLYKKMVKQFLQEASARAYAVKQERGRNRRGRSLLISITTIDHEMEKLIEDFVRDPKEPVDVLVTLDKIRGMLVDLMI
ncbi:MAG: YaaR family protein [Syntrophomonadaceae bacterium]|nr:YaaR family protein [Syntrophomonadaceae bacterium]MDD3271395.1 YaaR family protein [Syntrophomonadaceae bacterium]MDD3898019.1 YaaR family protein [Syntrophomonadaceae bacterium]MDD4562445.1 YaaR family protein [Syntrophomonadaceae bacterium]